MKLPAASLLSVTVRKLKTENLSLFTLGRPTIPDLQDQSQWDLAEFGFNLDVLFRADSVRSVCRTRGRGRARWIFCRAVCRDTTRTFLWSVFQTSSSLLQTVCHPGLPDNQKKASVTPELTCSVGVWFFTAPGGVLPLGPGWPPRCHRPPGLWLWWSGRTARRRWAGTR